MEPDFETTNNTAEDTSPSQQEKEPLEEKVSRLEETVAKQQDQINTLTQALETYLTIKYERAKADYGPNGYQELEDITPILSTLLNRPK